MTPAAFVISQASVGRDHGVVLWDCHQRWKAPTMDDGTHQKVTLGEVLVRFERGQSLPGWLYLPKGERPGLDTAGLFVDVDALSEEQVDENDEPLIALEQNLREALGTEQIEDIVAWVKNELENPPKLSTLLEAYLYYLDNDAFLPALGAQPPDVQEATRRADLDFYESLGAESETEICRRSPCKRGRISGSALCRPHHFEMIRERPCPFEY